MVLKKHEHWDGGGGVDFFLLDQQSDVVTVFSRPIFCLNAARVV
jgi:hypothetical protein